MSPRHLFAVLAFSILFSISIFAESSATRPGEAQKDAELPDVSIAALGEIRRDLLYTPFNAPCRILDTRHNGGARIASGETRPVYAINLGNEIESQGGRVGGCDVPFGAAAAMINFVAVAAEGPGNLRGAAFGTPIPLQGSIINYSNIPNLNIANAVPMPMCSGSCSYDSPQFHVQVNGAAVHLVADVLGYFMRHRSVFIHQVSVGTAHKTYLDHPELNGIINAAVMVTPYWRPESGAAVNAHPIAVYYDTTPGFNKWAIFNVNGAEIPAGSTFQVLILRQ